MTTNNAFKEKLQYDPSTTVERIAQIKKRLLMYYNSELKEDYKQHFSDEYRILKSQFPNVDFSYEGRIKNKNSLEEKINRKISQGKTGNVYDIFAKKIIIYSTNETTDEQDLINACYQIANFLANYNGNLKLFTEKCKDYIKTPKKNGYQAIHLLREHFSQELPVYCSEIQLRTFRMEEFQKFGTASHMLSYKPSETLKEELCPVFLEIGTSGKTYELPSKESFRKYKSDYEALRAYFGDLSIKR